MLKEQSVESIESKPTKSGTLQNIFALLLIITGTNTLIQGASFQIVFLIFSGVFMFFSGIVLWIAERFRVIHRIVKWRLSKVKLPSAPFRRKRKAKRVKQKTKLNFSGKGKSAHS